MFTVPTTTRPNHRGGQVHPGEPTRGTPAEFVPNREDTTHGLLAAVSSAQDSEPNGASVDPVVAAATVIHRLPPERGGVRETGVAARAREELVVPRAPRAAASHRAESHAGVS